MADLVPAMWLCFIGEAFGLGHEIGKLLLVIASEIGTFLDFDILKCM